MNKFETWSVVIGSVGLIINVGLFFGAVVQLRYLGRQLREAQESVRADRDRQRTDSTLTFYTSTIEHRVALRDSGLPSVYNVEEVRRFVASPSEGELRALIRYLGYWESFAAGVNTGAYDVDLVARLTGSRLRQVWTSYRDWILTRRESRQNPTLFLELELLAAELERRRPAQLRDAALARRTLPTET